MAEEKDCSWFSLSRQPQEEPREGSPTLEGEELVRWKAQFEPLLRHLRGKQVVLVLSGSGMALPCHVSVLKVLGLLEVPISGIYGTSGGAVVGGLYAAGMTVDQLERMMLDIRNPDELFGFASRHPAVRLAIGEIVRAIAGASLDRSAIFSSAGVGAYIEESMARYLGHSPLLSELKIPFSCVAFDTGAGRSEHGARAMAAKRVFSARTFPDVRLVDAIAASMAIPGTFPPKRIGDHYYIDGASVEDLPVTTAYDDWRTSRRFFRKKTVVIASDLGYAGGALKKETLGDPMAMVRYASAIQARATTIYSLLHCHRPRKGFSVILISPRTLTIRLWDIDKIPSALMTSYVQTVEQLSGSRFLDLTEEYIRSASSFLGLRSAAPGGSS